MASFRLAGRRDGTSFDAVHLSDRVQGDRASNTRVSDRRRDGDGPPTETHADGDAVDALVAAGHPVVDLQIEDIYDVGGLVFAWEVATLIASHLLRINPFDQPDVEAAKILARSMMDEYRSEGRLPSLTPALEVEGISVYGDIAANTLAGVIGQFLGSAARNAASAMVN